MTILPHLSEIMGPITSLIMLKAPVRLTEISFCQASCVISVNPAMLATMPALFTSTFTSPSLLVMVLIPSLICAGSEMSNTAAAEDLPFPRISRAVFSTSGRMSTTPTSAPSSAIMSAVALPIPRAAPVIKTTLPSKSIMSLFHPQPSPSRGKAGRGSYQVIFLQTPLSSLSKKPLVPSANL